MKQKGKNMFLREFLYVDTEKVRSTLAQIEGGIEEEERNTTKKEKRSEGGVRGFVGHYQNWGDERYVNKSLGDALFPVLEETLEAHGLLTDVSDRLADSTSWGSEEFRETFPPGSLVRITSPGSLFDSRFIASAMAGWPRHTWEFKDSPTTASNSLGREAAEAARIVGHKPLVAPPRRARSNWRTWSRTTPLVEVSNLFHLNNFEH
ncbi:hypothetical protein [Actinomadura sp. NTSP31]|uniref:DUF6414 family protein n=1 Tax=Actinomadura sp. NTSP31 TaxID=1735447 RepID=UPI0035BFE3D7